METKKALVTGAAVHAVLAMQTEENRRRLLEDGEVILTTPPGEIMEAIRNGEGYSPVDLDRVTREEDGSYRVSSVPVVNDAGLPNRLSIDRSSPYYTNCGAYVGVRFNGEEELRTIEFSVSGGWIRRGSDKIVKQTEIRDAPKEYGTVEVFWRSPPSRQVRRQIARMAR